MSTTLRSRDDLYIGGQWVRSDGSDTIEVENPATEQVIATVPEGTASDVDRAVAAAKAAFPGWAGTSVEQRATFLGRLGAALESRRDEIADTVTAEMGSPTRIAQSIQAGLPITVMKSYADILREFAFETEVGNSLVVREPIGVVGAITPWNYPLHQVVAKVAAALAAGCTIVLKPSEVAPLSAFALAEIIDEIAIATVTERGATRGDDRFSEAAMEDRKKEGYF